VCYFTETYDDLNLGNMHRNLFLLSHNANNNIIERGALLTLSIDYRYSLVQRGSFHARQDTGQQHGS